MTNILSKLRDHSALQSLTSVIVVISIVLGVWIEATHVHHKTDVTSALQFQNLTQEHATAHNSDGGCDICQHAFTKLVDYAPLQVTLYSTGEFKSVVKPTPITISCVLSKQHGRAPPTSV